MSLGQSLSIGSIVAIYGAGGAGSIYPGIVSAIMSPSGVSSRYINGVSFPPSGGPAPFQNLNHRSLSADGSGWDFASALPSFSL